MTDFNIATILEDGKLATSMSGTKPYMGKYKFTLLLSFHKFCKLGLVIRRQFNIHRSFCHESLFELKLFCMNSLLGKRKTLGSQISNRCNIFIFMTILWDSTAFLQIRVFINYNTISCYIIMIVTIFILALAD